MTKKNSGKKTFAPGSEYFFEHLWGKGLTYIRTVVDVVREPVLILDKNLRVIAANEPFYRKFQVEPKETENKIVFELGDGQWNIPALRKLLEDILPKDTFFKGFEVTHNFPSIGQKIMILNARRIYFQEDAIFKEPLPPESFRQIIILAIEDITEMTTVAESLANHTKNFENNLTERTQKMEARINKLIKEIDKLKRRPIPSDSKI
ncbi:MAG: PAS domain-containing protein [Patescibacteria group bacterium]|jgi:two-component system CheB/CheR fusion protein